MTIEPVINLPFHRMMRLADPRMTVGRGSTGAGVNVLGRVAQYPANVLRPRYHPITGVGEGFMVERQTANLLLQSEDASNASWTKTNLTVSANSLTAPDNAVTADTLTATGAGGNIAQAITITAGRGISISTHAKALASNFLYVKVSDGVNTVECWFNLSTGATATNTAGAGTCVFSQKNIEAYPNGWHRCMLDVTTATSTSFTITFGPAAADNTQPANTNSIYWWGAQAESEIAGATAPSGYIPTTTTTVTRSPDNIHLPVDSSWFNPSEGTMVFEFVNRIMPAAASGSHVFGGVANTFSDVIYLTRTGTTSVACTFGSSLGGGATIGGGGNYAITPGRVAKIAVAWATNDMSMVMDGGSPSSSAAAFTVPTNFARFGLGCAPWATSDNGNKPYATMRHFRYYARRLTTAQMQALTAA